MAKLTLLIASLLSLSSAFVVAPRRAVRASVQRAELNGWVPDESKFAWGLPGSPFQDATGDNANFDPAGFAEGCSLDQMKLYREAEIQHGRVAMLASVGFLVGEWVHPLFGLGGQEILAIDSLGEVRKVFPEFFEILTLAIGTIELGRALIGWVPPNQVESNQRLNADYYPGDIGFDPLGLKPDDADEFETLHTKELNNGRLAMIAIAGFVAQELVDRTPILLEDFGLGVEADPSNPLF